MPAFESTLAYPNPPRALMTGAAMRASRLTRRSRKPKSADGGPLLPKALKHGRAGKV